MLATGGWLFKFRATVDVRSLDRVKRGLVKMKNWAVFV